MQAALSFLSPLTTCEYLADRQWQLRYDVFARLRPHEYLALMEQGWRRFGYAVFRPECPACRCCRSLRVPVDRFRPDESQRRAWKQNHGQVTLHVGRPSVTEAKLDLYRRYHRFQHHAKGWPAPDDVGDNLDPFVENPFVTEEWSYAVDGRLIAVGYVDALPGALSAIYFYYDPDERRRSLGTFNVLSVLAAAAARGVPYVYLGYYVPGCRSLEYKARFRPYELLEGGVWRPVVRP